MCASLGPGHGTPYEWGEAMAKLIPYKLNRFISLLLLVFIHTVFCQSPFIDHDIIPMIESLEQLNSLWFVIFAFHPTSYPFAFGNNLCVPQCRSSGHSTIIPKNVQMRLIDEVWEYLEEQVEEIIKKVPAQCPVTA